MTSVIVHPDRDLGPLSLLWQSTGYTPASLSNSLPMQQAMILNSAVPLRGMRYIRPHYVLDLISGSGFGTDDPRYDWRALDRFFDNLVENNLAPILELMGNPSSWWTDFEDPVQVHAWRRLIRDLALRYRDRYGIDELRTWYFETWNEPDLGWWKWGEVGFLNYYDACSEGLAEVDPGLRFGGPGTAEPRSAIFRALMAHCDTGRNYFTGETGVRIDYISVHEKGGASSHDMVNASIPRIMDETKADWAWLVEHHPRLADRPFINDECDPLVGWKDHQTWRAWPYHASFAVNLIAEHLAWQDQGGPQVALLSNDNGFLGEFGKRTQFSIFGGSEDWPAGHFELFKKPIFTVMTALAMLGDRRLETSIEAADPRLRVIATRHGDLVAVALCFHDDRVRANDRLRLRLCLPGCSTGLCLAQWAVSEDFPNPFTVWEQEGHVPRPERGWSLDAWTQGRGDEVFALMRAAEDLPMVGQPQELGPEQLAAGIEVDMDLHSVHVLVFAPRLEDAPEAIEALSYTRWAGRGGGEQILLRWPTLDRRDLHGYEVQYRADESADWQTIADATTLDGAWRHVHPARPATGRYRVRARDLWQRCGPWSPELVLPALVV